MLDRLAEAGVERAVVNVHYLAEQIERHLQARTASADRDLGRARRCCSTPAAASSRRCRNSAARRSSTSIPTRIWIDGVTPNLARLAEAFDPAAMDALLLLAPTAGSIGYAGPRRFRHGAGRAA